MTVNDALLLIEGILGEIMSMGANDSENQQFKDIEDNLIHQKITPAEAVARARRILDIKQDYH